MHRLQVFTMVNQQRPEFVKDASLVPTPQSTMDRGIIAIFLRQLIPLATCSGAVEDAVQALSLVGARTPHFRRWIELGKKRSDKMLPQGIGDFPNGC